MKAILVIDMPTHCGECPVKCRMRGITHVPSWCPLKPFPKEEDIYEVGMDEEDTKAKQQWNKGWNACLEEITK